MRLSEAIQRASDYWEAETVAGLSLRRVRDPKISMWMLERNPNTRQDWGASETVTDAAVGLGQLYAAMTAAASATAVPTRLGSAVPGAATEPLPLLTERATDETEEHARGV